MTVQQHSNGRTLWLFNSRLSLMACWQPEWPAGFRFYFHENGGRRRGECLDLNLNVWRFSFAVTLWDMGWPSLLTRLIPAGYRKHGYRFGLMPAADMQ